MMLDNWAHQGVVQAFDLDLNQETFLQVPGPDPTGSNSWIFLRVCSTSESGKLQFFSQFFDRGLQIAIFINIADD